MRYSYILGEGFYKIKLADEMADLIDVHFSAAAQHFLMLKLEMSVRNRHFHLLRHRTHLMELINLVASFGDFENAIDESFRDLHLRSTWVNFREMPDPRMLNSMTIDPDLLKVGRSIPADFYIGDGLVATFGGFKKYAN